MNKILHYILVPFWRLHYAWGLNVYADEEYLKKMERTTWRMKDEC